MSEDRVVELLLIHLHVVSEQGGGWLEAPSDGTDEVFVEPLGLQLNDEQFDEGLKDFTAEF